MNVLVLQHIECEPPGLYEDVLHEHGATIHRVEVDAGEPLPDWRAFDALVVMGGPMGVNDQARFPWLTDELHLIREAVQAGTPYWGICLGSQLLAAALGARVYSGPQPEVGVLPVHLTPAASDDPIFHDLPGELWSLQWHGDTFDLPEGAVLLATSPMYPHQAFRWQSHAYALQFHLEVSVQMAREWGDVPAYRTALEQILGAGALTRLLADLQARTDQLQLVARPIFERWLDVATAHAASKEGASMLTTL